MYCVCAYYWGYCELSGMNYLKYYKTDSTVSVRIIVKLLICCDCQTKGHSLPWLPSLTAVEAVCRAYISWFVLPLILHAERSSKIQLLPNATSICLYTEKSVGPAWEVNSNACILVNVQTLPRDRSTLGNLDLNQGLLTTTSADNLLHNLLGINYLFRRVKLPLS